MPLMKEGPAPGDVFLGRWMTWPAEMSLTDREPDAPPVTIQVLADEEAILVEVADGRAQVAPGRIEHPDLTVSGPLRPVIGLFTGYVDLELAKGMGVELQGDGGVLRRVLPDPRA
jgi:hypothetical protein